MINHRSWKHWLLSICLVFVIDQVQAQEAAQFPARGPSWSSAPTGYGAAPVQYGAAPAGYGTAAMVPGAAPANYPPAAYNASAGHAPAGYPIPGYGSMAPAVGMQAAAMMPPEMMGMQPGGIQPAYYGAPVGGGACPACGGAGCQHCLGGAGGNDFRFDFLRYLLPDPSGGCCAPRWFDIHMEVLNMRREEISDTIDFTSEGITASNIVLSTDDLEFSARNGMRFSAAMPLRGGRHLEFSYFGLLDWADSAQATATTSPVGNLFSIMSNYGTFPAGGFDDTDRSDLQSIEYSSSLDSLELSFRSRWTGPNCVLQGSWLAGVRYIYLIEDFLYHTEGVDGFMDYSVATSNSMTGGQLGGDIWVCIMPGFKFGAEVKGGVYGSRAEQNTNLTSNSITSPLLEAVDVDKAAFALEIGLMFIYKVNQNFTVRGGYQSLAIDGLALAPENFNPTPPFLGGTRTPVINDTGSAIYHGFAVGLEWMW